MDDDNDAMQLDTSLDVVGSGWPFHGQPSDHLEEAPEVKMRDADPVLYDRAASLSPLLPAMPLYGGFDVELPDLNSLDCFDLVYTEGSLLSCDPVIGEEYTKSAPLHSSHLQESSRSSLQSGNSLSSLRPFPRSQRTSTSSYSTNSAPSNDGVNVANYRSQPVHIGGEYSVEGLGSMFGNNAWHETKGCCIQQISELHSSPTILTTIYAGASSRLRSDIDNEFLSCGSEIESTDRAAGPIDPRRSAIPTYDPMKLSRSNLAKHRNANAGPKDSLMEWLDAQLVSGPYRNGQHDWPQLIWKLVLQLRRQNSRYQNHTSRDTAPEDVGDYINVRGQKYSRLFLESVIEKEIHRQGGLYTPPPAGQLCEDQENGSPSKRSFEGTAPCDMASNAYSSPGSVVSSAASEYSIGSHASWSSRKGRRLDLPQYEDHFSDIQQNELKYPPKITNPEGKYRCQWCLTVFSRLRDLNRHEETQHAPQSEWICLADGEYFESPSGTLCALCKQTWNNYHRESCPYKLKSCMDRPESDRRFARKDKLKQHLIKMHGFDESSLPTEFHKWERAIQSSSETLWDCYLCTKQKMTWWERFEHIRKHRADHWKDRKFCRCTVGFSTSLQDVLSNAGLSNLWHTVCQAAWVCFDRSGCRTYDVATLEGVALPGSKSVKELDDTLRAMHETNTTDIYRCWYRDFPFAVAGAPRTFWCGYCCQLVIDKEKQYSSGSYDCAFLYHIDRNHTNPASNSSWKCVSVSQLTELFLCVYDSVLERLNTGVDFELSIKRALHWACEVLSHNLKIAGWIDPSLSTSEIASHAISSLRVVLTDRATFKSIQPFDANELGAICRKKTVEEFNSIFPVTP